MNFIVTLENSVGEKRQLNWHLLDNPLIRRWIDLMRNHRAETFHSQWDWWALGYSREHLDTVWSEMQDLVTLINKKDNAGINVLLIQSCTRENLNELHKQFHLLAENNNPSKEIHRLNYLVHIAENCVSNLSSGTDFGFMVSRFNNYYVEPLTNDDYQYFDSYIIQPGDLSMGYSTIGKNLRHCADNDDLEVIKQGMVRPKITLTSEIHAVFGSAGKGQRTEETVKNNYFKWCDDNNVESYGYNYREPVHTGGYCILGRMTDFDHREFTNWVITSDRVIVVDWQIV